MDTSMSVGSFISFGWEIFKKRSWFIIGATVVWFLLSWLASFVSTFTGTFAGSLLASEGSGGVVSFIVSLLLNALVSMGCIAFFIKAHDDIATVQLSALWHPQQFLNYVGVTILLWIIFAVGLILLIVPGIIAFTAFLFAPYFVIDKGMGPIEALKASARITKGNRLRVLGLLAGVMLVSFLGLLALVVGLLVAIPVTYLAYVQAYRRMSLAADAQEPHKALSGGEISLLVVGMILPLMAIVGITAAIVLASVGNARLKMQNTPLVPSIVVPSSAASTTP